MKNVVFCSVIVLLSIILFSLFFKQLENDKQMIIVKDSLYTELNKNKEYVFKNQALELSIKDLEYINKELHNEIKKMNENPKVIIKTVSNIKYVDKPLYDTVIIDKSNDIAKIEWNLQEDYSNGNHIRMNGESLYNYKLNTSESLLKDFDLSIKVYNSISKDKKGNYIVSARTDFPGVKFDNVNGYLVNNDIVKKKRKFGISMFIGPIYEPRNNIISVGIGAGLTYDILQF